MLLVADMTVVLSPSDAATAVAAAAVVRGERQLKVRRVNGPFRAACGNAADRVAVRVHGECGAGGRGCAAADDLAVVGGLAARIAKRVGQVEHGRISEHGEEPGGAPPGP
ncbi:hypothetical protein GCM10010251_26990 [Streptomyces aurantiogriseus]|uniref:Uncharacterized protein n=1 Tax=Streptomyces aurantiogriseus TaxID=66870 RepID=A0A918F6L8_9ACTN|nr:hypothetical protein GCM10010251_26990 [Streptomyces aurantiogriseus]